MVAQEQIKALAVVEEKNQNLEAKVTRLQDENERLQHADAERELAQADARQWSPLALAPTWLAPWILI